MSDACASPTAGLARPLTLIVAVLLLARITARAEPVTGLGELMQRAYEIAHVFGQLAVWAAPVLACVIWACEHAPPAGARRTAVLCLSVVAGTVVGVAARVAYQWLPGSRVSWDGVQSFALVIGARALILAGLLALALEIYRRAFFTAQAAQQAAIDGDGLERDLNEARLQMLQAQIEPHFLFNTLANVRRMCDTDREQAFAMLDSLARYLEFALPRLREADVTLNDDVQLVEAYLQLHRMRMGRRLEFVFDVPPGLCHRRVPTLMLLTLVENAVKHGIQPSREGGTVSVCAREAGNRMILQVSDNGVGLQPGSGCGTGLANVRARLSAQFGREAGLELRSGPVRGVTATLTLPLATAEGTP
jgi:signal transduction histidine kinase